MKKYLAANIIGVSDVEKASKWYEKIFDMTLVELKLPYFCEMKMGESIFLIEKHSPERPAGFQDIPTGVRVSAIIGVDDIKEFHQDCLKNDVKVVNEPVLQSWGGWNMIIADPDGNEFIIDQDNWE